MLSSLFPSPDESLEKQLEEAQQAHSEAVKRLEMLENEHQKKSKFANELLKKQAENYKKQLESAKKECNETLVKQMEEKEMSMLEKIQQLELQLLLKDKHIQQMEREQAQSNSKNDSLAKELKELRASVNNMRTCYEQKVANASAEFMRMQNLNETTQVALHSCQNQLNSQIRELESAKMELSQTESYVKQVEFDNNQLKMDNYVLRERLENTENILNEHKKLVENMESALKSTDIFRIVQNNWVPDVEIDTCQSAGCHKAFGIFTRKHHCRRCGGIFCADHLKIGKLPLIPGGTLHETKVCLNCQ